MTSTNNTNTEESTKKVNSGDSSESSSSIPNARRSKSLEENALGTDTNSIGNGKHSPPAFKPANLNTSAKLRLQAAAQAAASGATGRKSPYTGANRHSPTERHGTISPLPTRALGVRPHDSPSSTPRRPHSARLVTHVERPSLLMVAFVTILTVVSLLAVVIGISGRNDIWRSTEVRIYADLHTEYADPAMQDSYHLLEELYTTAEKNRERYRELFIELTHIAPTEHGHRIFHAERRIIEWHRKLMHLHRLGALSPKLIEEWPGRARIRRFLRLLRPLAQASAFDRESVVFDYLGSVYGLDASRFQAQTGMRASTTLRRAAKRRTAASFVHKAVERGSDDRGDVLGLHEANSAEENALLRELLDIDESVEGAATTPEHPERPIRSDVNSDDSEGKKEKDEI